MNKQNNKRWAMAEVCCYALIWISYSVLLVVHAGALAVGERSLPLAGVVGQAMELDGGAPAVRLTVDKPSPLRPGRR